MPANPNSFLPVEYLPILVLAAVAVVLPIAILFVAGFLGPKNPNRIKNTPYESGIREITSTPQRMPIKFYVVAMLFIVFDVEAIFFYPWAIALGELGAYGFYAMLSFMTVLLAGFFYAWKKGALSWE